MKKYLLFLTSLLLLASCSINNRDSRKNIMASLFDNEENSTLSEYSSNSLMDTSESKIEIIDAPIYEKVDIDLTTMNATMVYSQVLNMSNNPTAYVGKIVKMSGPFRPYDSTNPNYCYPAIIIEDATACCASGIEFLLYGIPRCSPKGGNGYPALEERVTIVGLFETYLEGTSMYIHLVDAIWLKDA